MPGPSFAFGGSLNRSCGDFMFAYTRPVSASDGRYNAEGASVRPVAPLMDSLIDFLFVPNMPRGSSSRGLKRGALDFIVMAEGDPHRAILTCRLIAPPRGGREEDPREAGGEKSTSLRRTILTGLASCQLNVPSDQLGDPGVGWVDHV